MSAKLAWPESLHAVLAASPDLAREFYLAASEVVDDFDDYGPVIQASDDGVYDASTTIEKLRVARDGILRALQERKA